MKIPFDIRYKAEIESGRYKVQTRDGQNVRIICWDARISSTPSKKNKYLICLHENPDGTESIMHHFSNGKVFFDECKADLFIVTPESELSEFELAVANIRYPTLCIDYICESEILREVVKEKSAKLLDIARKEIESKIKEEVVHDYWQHTADLQIQAKKEGYNEALKDIEQDPESSYAFKRGVEYGKAEALKNLPRWKKSLCVSTDTKGFSLRGYTNPVLFDQENQLEIPLSDLKRLPKED